MPFSSFTRERTNKFLDANIGIVEYEARRMVGVNFFSEVDLTQIERMRGHSGTGERRVPYTAFVIQAAARALTEFPYANARLFPRFPFGNSLVRFHSRDVAVAVERDEPGMEGTVFCDLLRSADERTLSEISGDLAKLARADETTNRQWREFARAIRLFPRWLARLIFRLPSVFPSQWVKYRGGAVVVSSPAKYGVDAISAHWIWPIGISFGLVRKRPVVRQDQVCVAPTFTLTMSFDRRQLAGAQAARFFHRIVELLEKAETELSLSR
ncbi:MAG: 2-oxo acid dehydrogenase subunit E2 [Oligoflexia bacterium]|nr:2-oxo acid dehydrogenase subunit E2 [Oligoflexia bacterium]